MIKKNGIRLDSTQKWGKLAGPVTSKQWKDERSAKEVAKKWHSFNSPNLPEEIEKILTNSKNFGTISKWEGEPEVKINFDSFHGPSNMDLIIHATDEFGDFVIGIEAKADEPLGNYVKDVFTDALERKIKNDASNGIKRIEQLANSLFSNREAYQTKIGELRYQLITGIAATLKVAKENNYKRALFLVQEFQTNSTSQEKLAKNKKDVDLFIKRITNGEITEINSGDIYGPIHIPAAPLFSDIPDLYFSKVIH